jgi:uncharacterized protein YecE (DUF72 family)
MQGNFILGCSGWNYPDAPDKGGWTRIFYPEKATKRLRYYSQIFNAAEIDATFYLRFLFKNYKRHFYRNGKRYSRKIPVFNKGT